MSVAEGEHLHVHDVFELRPGGVELRGHELNAEGTQRLVVQVELDRGRHLPTTGNGFGSCVRVADHRLQVLLACTHLVEGKHLLEEN